MEISPITSKNLYDLWIAILFHINKKEPVFGTVFLEMNKYKGFENEISIGSFLQNADRKLTVSERIKIYKYLKQIHENISNSSK